MFLLCRSCWFSFESLGICTSSQGATGGHCGGDRDRSASARRIRTTRLSRPPSVWALDLSAIGHRRNCGGGRDRIASSCRNCAIHVRHGTRLGVSSCCCGTGTPAPVVEYAEPAPVVMYTHAHGHRGRPVLVSVVFLWHAHRFFEVRVSTMVFWPSVLIDLTTKSSCQSCTREPN